MDGTHEYTFRQNDEFRLFSEQSFSVCLGYITKWVLTHLLTVPSSSFSFSTFRKCECDMTVTAWSVFPGVKNCQLGQSWFDIAQSTDSEHRPTCGETRLCVKKR